MRDTKFENVPLLHSFLSNKGIEEAEVESEKKVVQPDKVVKTLAAAMKLK